MDNKLTPHEAIYDGSRESYVFSHEPSCTHIDPYFSYLFCDNPFQEQWLKALKHGIDNEITKRLIEHYEPQPKFVFDAACKYGNIPLAQWVLTWRGSDYLMEYSIDVFQLACKCGHLKMAQWLVQTLPVFQGKTAQDKILLQNIFQPTPDEDYGYYNDPFRLACKGGHLHVVMWLAQTFIPNIHQTCDNVAFQWACAKGHLHVAQWLIRTFPRTNHRSHNDAALIIACSRGHLHIVKWLMQTLSYDGFLSNMCILEAIESGHLHIIKYLIMKFPGIDPNNKYAYIFVNACEFGHLHIAQWLVRSFPYIDYPSYDTRAFREAHSHGHFLVARWLVRTFPQIYNHTNNTSPRVKQWLVKTFPEFCDQIKSLENA